MKVPNRYLHAVSRSMGGYFGNTKRQFKGQQEVIDIHNRGAFIDP